MATYWHTPDFIGKTFRLCVLNRWDFNFCVQSSPPQGWQGIYRWSHALFRPKTLDCQIYTSSLAERMGWCSTEVWIRIASVKAAMARLNRIWQCNTVSIACKFKLYKSLVTSILLHGCETWTLFADSVKGIQAFKTKLSISPTWSTRPTT